MSKPFVRALPAVQHYAWGHVGEDSMVAKLNSLASNKDIVTDKPSAELWMGTHPNGPAKVMNEDGSTTEVKEYLGRTLPYLYKVLSVRTALSIQAHPHASLAEKLHAERPLVYKDPNAKPEMAIALTTFECMVGFRPMPEILDYLSTVPELRELLGESECDAFVAKMKGATTVDKFAFRELFTRLMNADAKLAALCAESLSTRLEGQVSKKQKTEETKEGEVGVVAVEDLIPQLQAQYPGDIGVFCPYLLNCVRLQPGMGVFLEPDVPHAYIAGNILECMGPSDNVVRAGLTPKLRDTPVLCSMLTYDCGLPTILRGEDVNDMTRLFQPPPPFNELNTFRLLHTRVPPGESCKLSGLTTHAMLLVLEGSGSLTDGAEETVALSGGFVVLVQQDQPTTITNTGDVELVCATCYSSNYHLCGVSPPN